MICVSVTILFQLLHSWMWARIPSFMLESRMMLLKCTYSDFAKLNFTRFILEQKILCYGEPIIILMTNSPVEFLILSSFFASLLHPSQKYHLFQHDFNSSWFPVFSSVQMLVIVPRMEESAWVYFVWSAGVKIAGVAYYHMLPCLLT